MRRFFSAVLRNIKRNPLFTLINLSGLVLGFACIMMIAIWIRNELSYDTFHPNKEDIYRVHRYFYDPDGKENLHLPYVAPPVTPMLEKELKEVEHIARVFHNGMSFTKDEAVSLEDDVCFAEPEILKIFSFEGLPADESLLKEPMTMIISDNQAMQYFNKLDAIGETIEFTDDQGESHDLKISGVFKQWDQNSHFHPEFLISFTTFRSFVGEEEFQRWGSNNYETFALIPHLPADINSQLDNMIDEYLENGTDWTKIRLESLTDIHFNWYSNESYVYILASISLLILIIGSINYMNLNVAMYTRRLEEIKMKKIMGASQKKLSLQLLAESILFCFTALILAMLIVWMVIAKFSEILGYSIRFNPGDNILLIGSFVLIALLTGAISVIYPAIVLSSFKPVSTKISDKIAIGKASFRTGLVVFQFFVSIALITSFLFVYKQLNYVHHKELGLDKENIITIPTTPQLIEKLDVFKQQLLSNPNILNVSASKRIPSDGLLDSDGAELVSGGEANPLDFRLANVRVDEDFLATYKIPLSEGRNFDGKNPGYGSFILNEAAVRQIGWKSSEEAIGQAIRYGGEEGTVIGVIKDFHYESLYYPISPILIVHDPTSFNRISIRVTSHDRQETLALIEETWQKYNLPNYSFFYEYVDDRFAELYRSEESVKSILSYFMVIAISIAILGLIGLSLFLIQRRVKEIGVRKVNGARVWEVMTLLNRDFLKWVGIAFVIATPIAWYGISEWLENFAYKTEISWWIFALAGMMAVIIALLTVSWQSWKAATRNPVEALRYE